MHLNKSFLILISLLICSAFSLKKFSNKFIGSLYERRNLEELLSGVINHLLIQNKINCMSIVSDTNYLNMFSGQWFLRTNSTPAFMTVVEEPEDLLSPNYDTLESLRQTRKDGCKLYIILLANGFQVARLLKFGEKYRLIDTRANFVMLHDLRIFVPKYHFIWKRVINVIFIRSHQQKDSSKNSTHWYELSTVPFPYPIRDVLIPKRIQSWKVNTLFKSTSLFPEKTFNLKGHAINIVAFQHVPAVVKVQLSSKKNNLFNGMEIEGKLIINSILLKLQNKVFHMEAWKYKYIMSIFFSNLIVKTIAKVMNFKPKIYEPTNANVEKWGRKLLNGSFTGLFGEMVNGNSDLALGNLHYTPYNLQLTDLTIPYISECLTFLTPEALSDNSWKTLILPFKLYMWIAVLLVLMMSGFIFYLLAQFHKRLQKPDEKEINKETNLKAFCYDQKSENDKEDEIKKPYGLYLFEELSNSILYTYGMLLVISLPRLPPAWSMRLLTGCYWLYCVLVVTSYRASMTAILANPAPRVTIDTMVQLAENSISCAGWGEQTKEFFTKSSDEVGQKIGKKFEIVKNPIKAIQKIIKGELAYYENKYFLKYLMARQELNNKQKKEMADDKRSNTSHSEEEESEGDRNLHIMKECAIQMPISVGLQKNSPLKHRIDKLLRRLIEAGLIEKWLKDVMVPINAVTMGDEENIKAEINLKKLYVGFVSLGIGYGVSFLAFIGEILHWRYVVLRDPKFDYYAQYDYFKNKKEKKSIPFLH